MAFHKAVNDFQVTLNGAVGAGDTTFTVTGSVSPISTILPVYLTVENEIVEVTAVAGQDLTVVRGAQSTNAVAHNDATTVSLNITAAQINEIIDDKQDAGGSVFGSEFAYFSKVADESTASTTPVVYHSVNTPILPAGTYLLQNYAVQTGGSANQTHFMQVTVDSSVEGYIQLEPSDPNNQHPWSLTSRIILLSDASITINLEYGKISGASTTIIKESRITYWRVS